MHVSNAVTGMSVCSHRPRAQSRSKVVCICRACESVSKLRNTGRATAFAHSARWSGVNRNHGCDFTAVRAMCECWSVIYKETKKLESAYILNPFSAPQSAGRPREVYDLQRFSWRALQNPAIQFSSTALVQSEA